MSPMGARKAVEDMLSVISCSLSSHMSFVDRLLFGSIAHMGLLAFISKMEKMLIFKGR